MKPDKKELPVYLHSAGYAREHGELAQYRASFQANVACREAMEKSIASNYANNHLDTDKIMEEVSRKFSMERMKLVLANTVQWKGWDGRFSPDNKRWAKSVAIAGDLDSWGNNRNDSFVIDGSHPLLLDGFIAHFRKELEKTPQEEKPSVLEKLKAPLPEITASGKRKAQEL